MIYKHDIYLLHVFSRMPSVPFNLLSFLPAILANLEGDYAFHCDWNNLWKSLWETLVSGALAGSKATTVGLL